MVVYRGVSNQSSTTTAKTLVQRGLFSSDQHSKLKNAVERLKKKATAKRQLTHPAERSRFEALCQEGFDSAPRTQRKSTSEMVVNPPSFQEEPLPPPPLPDARSPVERRLRGCTRCLSKGATGRALMQAKKRQIMELRKTVKDLRKQVQSIKRLNETIKRKEKQLNKIKQENTALREELKEYKKKESKEAQMKVEIDEYKKQLKKEKAEEEKLMKKLKNQVCCELQEQYKQEISALIESPPENQPDFGLAKDGKSYPFNIRLFMYICLLCNAPTEQIPKLIKFICKMFKTQINIPS
jgi:hypothetical protein